MFFVLFVFIFIPYRGVEPFLWPIILASFAFFFKNRAVSEISTLIFFKFYCRRFFVKCKGKRQFPGVYTEVKIGIRPYRVDTP